MQTGRVMKNLIDTYLELRRKIDVSLLRNFNVIIIMQPKIFMELREELNGDIRKEKNINCYFIQFCGQKTPILIDYELPKEVEFQIMTQRDYERIEKEKMIERLNKMFYER